MAEGRLPNLVVIGAQKCGTTSLHYYLGLHPEISMAASKELDFFHAGRNWRRGVEWYRSHFTRFTPVRGESSPTYTNHPWFAGVPQRMAATIPDARLIYLVGDPIRRIVSQYVHRLAMGPETRSLSQALAEVSMSNPYVTRSLYHWQLQQYLPYYPLERILIVPTEDLYANRYATLRQIFTFLGVDPDFSSPGFERIKFRSQDLRRLHPAGQRVRDYSYRHMNRRFPALQRLLTHWLCYPLSDKLEWPQMDEAQRRALCEAVWPDAQELRSLTGLSLSQWSV